MKQFLSPAGLQQDFVKATADHRYFVADLNSPIILLTLSKETAMTRLIEL